jgi:hypothetical protein
MSNKITAAMTANWPEVVELAIFFDSFTPLTHNKTNLALDRN